MLLVHLQGITDSYCYLGGYNTTFPIHCEDQDLSAVNYLHWGRDKVWYIVPPGQDADRLDEVVLKSLTDSGHVKKPCENIMRHKEFLITPDYLRNNKINFHVIFQKAGEFVVTFPRAYHEGFNLSCNFAESTNFGSKRWLQFGRQAKQCTCRPSTSTFNMDLLDDM